MCCKRLTHAFALELSTNGLEAEVIRAVDPATVAAPVRRTIESLGREYPLRIQTLRDRENWAFMQERLISILSLFFSGLALLLASPEFQRR